VFNESEQNALILGLNELLRDPHMIPHADLSRVVRVLSHCAVVGPMRRGEDAPAAAVELSGRFFEPPPDEWITVSEAAELIGRPAATVRRWCRIGRVPEYARRRDGSEWRIEWNEFRRWLDEQ